jgi:hypothetical protein
MTNQIPPAPASRAGWPGSRLHRRDFLRRLLAAGAVLGSSGAQAARQPPDRFVFARLRYASGDWDYNPRVASNVLDSLMRYTSIPVEPREVVVDLSEDALFDFPFLFMTGHLPVRFRPEERRRLERYLRNGGLLFSDDCNHDVDGAYAQTFEKEMAAIFEGAERMHKLPNDHEIYRCFFAFDDGPPTTSHELNGWGDDMVHDYLQAVEIGGRAAVIYSNKDYGCEWDYDYRNKRFYGTDNTRFAVNLVVYALTR